MHESKPKHSQTKPEEWIDLYGDYLYRYALMRLKNPELAGEVVQETFVAALQGLHNYSGEYEIKYWLRGILRNKVVDQFRASQRMTPVEDVEVYEKVDDTLMKYWGIPTRKVKPWQFDAHKAMEQEDFWAAFEGCLSGLSDFVRKAYVLKEIDELETEEVCKILDIKPNYLWVLVYRARKQLKGCLEKKWV